MRVVRVVASSQTEEQECVKVHGRREMHGIDRCPGQLARVD